MTRVLVLSTTTGYQLRSFNTAAEQLGIELVFGTDRCQQLDDPWRDRAIAVRFHEEALAVEAIVDEARRSPFQGVIAVGDRPAILAARVAERLGLPGNSPDAAAASGNKLEARRRLSAAGLKVPSYFTLPSRGDGRLAAADARIEYPVVLKPLGLSGSRGVIRADSPTEFAAAFARISTLLARVDVRAARTGLEDVLLVERFIRGREFAIEGVLTAGRLQVFTIFDKPDPLDGPFFEETIYVTPSSLGPASQLQLAQTVQQSADALGLWHGPVHAECRVGPDGIFVLETAARPIGGLCSKALRFADGSSLEAVLLRHAIGEDVSTAIRETGGVSGDDDSDPQSWRARARRRRSRGPTGRACRGCAGDGEDWTTARAAARSRKLPRIHLRESRFGRRRGGSRSRGARTAVVHDPHDD